jgi:hypothetical protein
MALHDDSFASAHEFEYVPQKKTYSSFANASTHSMANFCYPQTLCWQQGGRAAHGKRPGKEAWHGHGLSGRLTLQSGLSSLVPSDSVQHERDGQRKTLFLGPIQEQHTNKKGK